jgi:hypothetical protein
MPFKEMNCSPTEPDFWRESSSTSSLAASSSWRRVLGRNLRLKGTGAFFQQKIAGTKTDCSLYVKRHRLYRLMKSTKSIKNLLQADILAQPYNKKHDKLDNIWQRLFVSEGSNPTPLISIQFHKNTCLQYPI